MFYKKLTRYSLLLAFLFSRAPHLFCADDLELSRTLRGVQSLLASKSIPERLRPQLLAFQQSAADILAILSELPEPQPPVESLELTLPADKRFIQFSLDFTSLKRKKKSLILEYLRDQILSGINGAEPSSIHFEHQTHYYQVRPWNKQRQEKEDNWAQNPKDIKFFTNYTLTHPKPVLSAAEENIQNIAMLTAVAMTLDGYDPYGGNSNLFKRYRNIIEYSPEMTDWTTIPEPYSSLYQDGMNGNIPSADEFVRRYKELSGL